MTLDKSSRSPKATAVRNPIPTLSRCRGSVESPRQAARSTRFNTIDLIQAHIVIDYRPLIGTQHSLERQLLHHRSTHHVSGRSGRRDEQEPGNTEHRTYSLTQLWASSFFDRVYLENYDFESLTCLLIIFNCVVIEALFFSLVSTNKSKRNLKKTKSFN